MKKTQPSVPMARIVRDSRDARTDKLIPLSEARALYEAGKLWAYPGMMPGWECYGPR